MCRVTLMTLGSPGLRAGKSLGFLLLGGLTRPGRARTKQADMRIFSKKAAIARSSRSGGSRDRAGRGEETAFKATAFETSQWLPWQKPDTTWAWKLIRLDVGLQHSLALLTADGQFFSHSRADDALLPHPVRADAQPVVGAADERARRRRIVS